ncbi:MAG: hypothetical protein DI606_09645 [Sphingobium sp.]|jgi:hypothetical protein|uniref:hypothetical protein n=1 Tax=Sphingobium sp. TaxID=1912891 RepID=UPI000DB53CF9|nr:hypothetical protein [Sphingobium sp.]PZU12333.1 MAG: hypothetical protein DI606_09645 [Sphingobium sp.]
MKPPVIPCTYDEWKHCITVLCRIPLTPAFVEARIAALANPRDYGTLRFVETWGEAHRDRVTAWFLEARAELAAGDAA